MDKLFLYCLLPIVRVVVQWYLVGRIFIFFHDHTLNVVPKARPVRLPVAPAQTLKRIDPAGYGQRSGGNTQ